MKTQSAVSMITHGQLYKNNFAYPGQKLKKFVMTKIHDFVCDLAKARKSVKEIMDIVESAYPGQGHSEC